MEFYSILLPLALILLLSKLLIKGCQKINLPSVVGMLLAGVVIGLISYIPNQTVLTEGTLGGLGFIAKIGVILIMFSAGIETDIKQIKAVGVPAVVITLAGVIVPMGLGFVVACLFNGGFTGMTREVMFDNLFYGVILTATSVSVTVATLRELGKLNGKVGSTIVSAAILDDIIGVIVLSLVVALKGGNGSVQTSSPWIVILKTVLFFIAAIIIGLLASKLFDYLEKRFPHHRMLPILSISLCFFFSYASEKWFGVADITGAFIAGVILSRNPESHYIERKSDIMGYMIFSPVFFANIGITTKFDAIDGKILFFGVCLILAGLVGKFFGCGLSSFACKYGLKDSAKVGIGMMARAEVALVCAQKGVENGMINQAIMPFIVILIIVSSFVTPIVLRLLFKNELGGSPDDASQKKAQVPEKPASDGAELPNS